MKAIIFGLTLLASLPTFAGEPSKPAASPGKPQKLSAVWGRRENISPTGPWAIFKCIDDNKICLYKIEAAGRPSGSEQAPSPTACPLKDISPDALPPIFEEKKLYLGLYDSKNTLQIYEIETFEILSCGDGATTVKVTPYIEINP